MGDVRQRSSVWGNLKHAPLENEGNCMWVEKEMGEGLVRLGEKYIGEVSNLTVYDTHIVDKV